MKLLTIFLTLVVLASTSCSDSRTDNNSGQSSDSLRSIVVKNQATIDSLVKLLGRQRLRESSLEFLSTGDIIEVNGPDGIYGHSFRVEIYQSEIYKSLFISQINHFGESQSKLLGTKKFEIVKELKINNEATSNLQFSKWLTPTEFEVTVGDKKFGFSIINLDDIKVQEKE